MRRSSCHRLSDVQVARIEARCRALNLTREKLLERFNLSLKAAGVYHGVAAARMRLNRALNRRMRRPISGSTKAALAVALDWTITQMENAIRVGSKDSEKRTNQGKQRGATLSEIAQDLNDVARRLPAIARKLKKLAR